MVFQNPYASLNPRRSVGDQITDGLAVPREEQGREVARLLELVGLEPEAADRYPHQFSGGQRQRVAIARALAARPDVLVADEPVTALDASSQAQIVNLLTSLVDDLGLGMLFISHDLALVREIADVTAVMYLGRIVEHGPTEQVWSQPRHPYTRTLIEALPRISADAHLPVGLRGEVPDGAHVPTGCRFRTRCPAVMPICTTEPPVVVDGEHTVACWLADESTLRASATEGAR